MSASPPPWGWRWRRLLTYGVVGFLLWQNSVAMERASPETVWIIAAFNILGAGAIGLTYLGTAARGDFLEFAAKLAEAGARIIPQSGGWFGMGGVGFGVDPAANVASELPPEEQR